ncbi:hypothetical protein, partial [Vibrio vulnificus]|uniref:hypothetical protein n=1 Tax=Vibrio vulnificus TaxID=672 RepID=UPI001A8E990C
MKAGVPLPRSDFRKLNITSCGERLKSKVCHFLTYQLNAVCHVLVKFDIMRIMLRASTSKRFSRLACTQQAATMSKFFAHPLRASGQRQTLNIIQT